MNVPAEGLDEAGPSTPYQPQTQRAVTKTDILKGSLVWDIVGITALNKKPGEFIESPLIRVGELEWICKIYPKGDKVSETNEVLQKITCFFNLQSKRDVHSANAKLTVLPKSVATHPRSLSTGFITWKGNAGFGWRGFLEVSELSFFISDDSLHLICDIEVASQEKTISSPLEGNYHSTSSVEPKCNLSENLDLLLGLPPDESFSDVTFIVEGVEFFAHKCILVARSPVFMRMFRTNMKERANGIVEITDISSVTFAQMLQYIYSGRCELTDRNTEEMLAVADKYDLSHLKLLCENQLSRKLKLENVGSTLLLADMYHSDQLKKQILTFAAAHFVDVIATEGFKELYTKAPALLAEVHDALAEKAGTKRPAQSNKRNASAMNNSSSNNKTATNNNKRRR